MKTQKWVLGQKRVRLLCWLWHFSVPFWISVIHHFIYSPHLSCKWLSIWLNLREKWKILQQQTKEQTRIGCCQGNSYWYHHWLLLLSKCCTVQTSNTIAVWSPNRPVPLPSGTSLAFVRRRARPTPGTRPRLSPGGGSWRRRNWKHSAGKKVETEVLMSVKHPSR